MIKQHYKTKRWVQVVAGVASLGLALSACGGDSDADGGANPDGPTMKVRYAISPNAPGNLLSYVALEEGLFEDRGIEVETIDLAGPDAHLAASLGGEVDVFISSAAVMTNAFATGECVQAVSTLFMGPFSFVGRSDADWPDAGSADALKALEGKTVGVVSLAGAPEAATRTAMQSVGADDEKVTFVAVGLPATAVPAFEEGQVDALVTFPPQTAMLDSSKYEMLWDSPADPNSPIAAQVSSLDVAQCGWVKQNPEAAAAHCAALHDATTFARDPKNRAAMEKYATDYLGTDPAVGASSWEEIEKIIPETPSLTAEMWEEQRVFVGADLEELMPSFDKITFEPCATGSAWE